MPNVKDAPCRHFFIENAEICTWCLVHKREINRISSLEAQLAEAREVLGKVEEILVKAKEDCKKYEPQTGIGEDGCLDALSAIRLWKEKWKK